MSKQALLSVKSLTKFYVSKNSKLLVKAVEDVNFELAEDCTLGIVGESGCGKTTVARCILKLVDITKGEIFFKGKEIGNIGQNAFRPYRKNIQAVFQNPHDALDPRMKIKNLLKEPLLIWNDNLSQQTIDETIGKLLKENQLDDSIMEKYPHQLSGGQLQKISIALAIANRPQLIVLDEPTTSLDAESSAELINLLINIKKELHNSYIFISHDLHAVEDICDMVAVMYLGRIVETGPKEQVFNHPHHPYTKALMSSMLRITTNPKDIKVLKGEVPSPVYLPKGCYFCSRCEERMAQCAKEYPGKTILEKDQYVYCFKYQNNITKRRGNEKKNI